MGTEEKKYLYQGKTYTIGELQKLAKSVFDNELRIVTIKHRLNRGWAVGDAIAMAEGKRRAMFKKINEELSPAQKQKKLDSAREYRKEHSKRLLKNSAKQKFNTYLREFADIPGLKELKELIKKRRAELNKEK